MERDPPGTFCYLGSGPTSGRRHGPHPRVRPEDNVRFGGTGDQSGLYIINPRTGAATLIGNTGPNFVGDFALSTVPEPSQAVVVVSALLLLALRRRALGRASQWYLTTTKNGVQ